MSEKNNIRLSVIDCNLSDVKKDPMYCMNSMYCMIALLAICSHMIFSAY